MRRYLAVLIALSVAFVSWTTPGYADMQQPAVVSADPVDWTPNIFNGQVNAIAVVGDTVVVGGDFSRIAEAGQRRAIRRPFLFAFHATTGRFRDFRPDLDGPVNALVPGPNDTVIVGGAFRWVNDQRRRGIVKLNLFNGEISDGFEGTIDTGEVRAMEIHGNDLYVAGNFSSAGGGRQPVLTRLDARTGLADREFQISITAPNHPRVKLEDISLSPDGRKLVIIGEITRVNGEPRSQLAVLNVGSRRPTVDPWYTMAYDSLCHRAFDTTCAPSTSRPTARTSWSSPRARSPARGACATPPPGSTRRAAASTGPPGSTTRAATRSRPCRSPVPPCTSADTSAG
ncbi:hypothetical protein ACFQX7_17505 [Luedemannella flava]